MDSSAVKTNGLTTAQQASLERIWAQLVCLMQHGHVSEVDMPMNIKYQLGWNGLSILVSRFSEFITAKVAMTEDIENMTIHMKPTFQSWGFTIIPDLPEENTETSKETMKAPRPPNAFILYRQYWHPFVKAAHPELHNTQISIIIGRQWNNEDEAVKDEWRRKADEYKKQHAITYPKYQYQPRKPSEKKRRVTRRKSATSSAAIVPDFQKNIAGNLVITLAEDDLDDATFEAMHHNYNMSLPANRPAISALGSVIYTGHSEKSQEGWAIYQSQMDRIINNAPTDADVDAEFARVFHFANKFDEAWGMMNADEQAFRWDMVQDIIQNKASKIGSGHLVADA